MTIHRTSHRINGMDSQPPVILITGASAGIGEATARLFGRAGHRVALAARRLDRLEEVGGEIRAQGGEAKAFQVDVTEAANVSILVKQVIEHYGRVDILLNNAGIGRLNWLEKVDPVLDIEALIKINLLAPMWMAQAVLPQMIERRSGHIINMASLAGFIATPTYSLYAASKFGLRGFSESLRREVGIYGIHVSALYPGGVRTEFAAADVARRKTGIRTPRWLVLTPEDVARAVFSLVQRPRRSLIIPWPMRFGVWLNTILPGFVDWGIQEYFVKRERG